jgi:hypothetical protein
MFAKTLLFILIFSSGVQAEATLPKGLMLNLDFENAENGLIPNRALYPLYVPQGDLGIEAINYRKTLVFKRELGLDIPHSSMLEPNGNEWIVTLRVAALSDGMLISQDNGEYGYAIYIQDGAAHAIVRTGSSAVVLKESPESGITDFKKDWVTIELRIKPDMALLTLNRKRAALVLLQSPLQGEDMRIRLGNHHRVPSFMQHIKGAEPTGFDGAVSSLKILRQ